VYRFEKKAESRHEYGYTRDRRGIPTGPQLKKPVYTGRSVTSVSRMTGRPGQSMELVWYKLRRRMPGGLLVSWSRRPWSPSGRPQAVGAIIKARGETVLDDGRPEWPWACTSYTRDGVGGGFLVGVSAAVASGAPRGRLGAWVTTSPV